MFIDTHCHLWWDSYASDLENVIARAKEAGVTQFVVPGTDLHSSHRAVELARRYPGVVFAAVGIHPEETINTDLAVTQDSTVFNGAMRKLRELVATHRDVIVAIGEIGTDANTQDLRDHMTDQMNLLREQSEIALAYDLPVIIHSRASMPETFQVLDSLPTLLRGQFHCFSYDTPELAEILSRGFSVSFCGNISWSKRLQRVIPHVPADKLLLETDSPLMIPRTKKSEPYHISGGQPGRNEPVNAIILAQIQAELRGISVEELGTLTRANTQRLFGIR